MKSIFRYFLISLALFSYAAKADNTQQCTEKLTLVDLLFYSQLKVDTKTLDLFKSFASNCTTESATPPITDPIAAYETYIPRKSQPNITGFERRALSAYLDNPANLQIVKFLALYHLKKSVLNSINRADASALKNSIISLYFFNRAKDLGDKSLWLSTIANKLQSKLDLIGKKNSTSPISLAESHYAHTYFLQTFNYNEENRFNALNLLLSDYLNDPRNMHTVFLNTAINLWIGGETDYDDPTIVYNFVLGSYFSIIAMDFAHQLEINWQQNPETNKRYRLSNILGGFSVLQRGWLATLHKDMNAKNLIDDEHRAWRLVQPVFHSFTVGLSFFENPFTFLEAKQAWEDGINMCPPITQTDLRTCTTEARFSFNGIGMILSYVDFNLKAGDMDAANFYLFVIQNFEPTFPYWVLGRDAINHRINHMSEIAEHYQNADPSDDPMNFFLKRKKWGTNTATCQTCHQAQDRIWTQEEKDKITLPTEEYSTVGNWPAVSTSWYGATK